MPDRDDRQRDVDGYNAMSPELRALAYQLRLQVKKDLDELQRDLLRAQDKAVLAAFERWHGEQKALLGPFAEPKAAEDFDDLRDLLPSLRAMAKSHEWWLGARAKVAWVAGTFVLTVGVVSAAGTLNLATFFSRLFGTS